MPRKFELSDVAVLLGIASVIAGIAMIYQPAAFIVAGSLMTFFGLRAGRKH